MAEYVPALRFRSLTALYDPVARWVTRETRFKPALLEAAKITAGHQVLDVGCGTGTLAIEAAERTPGAKIVGLDADREILDRAVQKAGDSNVQVQFDEALATDLPYENESFDRVLSTLFFHHLTTPEKRRTAVEIHRVLKARGELHVVDFDRAQDPLMWLAFSAVRGFDGFERTRVNAAGKLGEVFQDAGLVVREGRRRFRTAFGTVGQFTATKAS